MNIDTTQNPEAVGRNIANEPQLPDDFPVTLPAGELRKLIPGIQLLGPYPTVAEANRVSLAFPESLVASDEGEEE